VRDDDYQSEMTRQRIERDRRIAMREREASQRHDDETRRIVETIRARVRSRSKVFS